MLNLQLKNPFKKLKEILVSDPDLTNGQTCPKCAKINIINNSLKIHGRDKKLKAFFPFFCGLLLWFGFIVNLPFLSIFAIFFFVGSVSLASTEYANFKGFPRSFLKRYRNLGTEFKCEEHNTVTNLTLSDVALLKSQGFSSLELKEELDSFDAKIKELEQKPKPTLALTLKRVTPILILALLITSCSSNVSKDWSTCRKTDSKLGCASISQADDAYSKIDEEPKTETLSNTKSNEDSDSKYSSFKDKRLVRTGDKVGRIWIAPYKDANDNYHEESYIQIVDETGKWEVRKKEIIVKDYKLDDEPLDSLKDYQEISLEESN